MASKLKPNATTAEINEFLNQIRIPYFRIHPRLVEFNNAQDRNRKITLFRNKLITEGLPEDAAENQSKELLDADTLSVGAKSLTQKGSVLMLAGMEKKDLEQGLSSEEAYTHVMLVFLKERKVCYSFNCYILIANLLKLYVYDPDWEMTVPHELTEEEKEKMKAEHRKYKDFTPRLGEITGGARLRKLYAIMKNGKFGVDEIWMGGGGNGGFECLTMCQDQLELMENLDEEALNFAWAEEKIRE